MQVLDLIRKENNCILGLLKIYGKNRPSACEVVKEGKDIHASSAVTPQPAKVTLAVRAKCLVTMENALNLWVKDRQKIRSDGQ